MCCLILLAQCCLYSTSFPLPSCTHTSGLQGCLPSVLKEQRHEIFCFWFFHESVSPQPHGVSHQDRFKFFQKVKKSSIENLVTLSLSHFKSGQSSRLGLPLTLYPHLSDRQWWWCSCTGPQIIWASLKTTSHRRDLYPVGVTIFGKY